MKKGPGSIYDRSRSKNVFHTRQCKVLTFYPVLVLKTIYIIALPGIPDTCKQVSFWNMFKSSSLPVDRKYENWQLKDNDIILLFNAKYKRRWINVNFMQDKPNINAML